MISKTHKVKTQSELNAILSPNPINIDIYGEWGDVCIPAQVTVGRIDISGTVTGSIDISGTVTGSIDISGTVKGNIDVSGTVTENIYVYGTVTGNIDVSGIASVRNIYVSGIASVRNIYVSGIASVRNIYVSGTVTGSIYVSGNVMESIYVSGTVKEGISVAEAEQRKFFGKSFSEIMAAHDLILECALPNEIAALRKALVDGEIDGHIHEWACACVVTPEKARGVSGDSMRLAELWYMGISKGHTPETNIFSKYAVKWIDAFISELETRNKTLRS